MDCPTIKSQTETPALYPIFKKVIKFEETHLLKMVCNFAYHGNKRGECFEGCKCLLQLTLKISLLAFIISMKFVFQVMVFLQRRHLLKMISYLSTEVNVNFS